MAKSKNHTGHNDNEKAHRNGIKVLKILDLKSIYSFLETQSLC